MPPAPRVDARAYYLEQLFLLGRPITALLHVGLLVLNRYVRLLEKRLQKLRARRRARAREALASCRAYFASACAAAAARVTLPVCTGTPPVSFYRYVPVQNR